MHTQKDKCIEWYYQQCYIRIHTCQSSCRDHGLKKKFMQSNTFQIMQPRARVQAVLIQQNWIKVRFVFEQQCKLFFTNGDIYMLFFYSSWPVFLHVLLSAFNVYPGTQLQLNDPGVFWHPCSQPDDFSRHSFISIINVNHVCWERQILDCFLDYFFNNNVIFTKYCWFF